MAAIWPVSSRSTRVRISHLGASTSSQAEMNSQVRKMVSAAEAASSRFHSGATWSNPLRSVMSSTRMRAGNSGVVRGRFHHTRGLAQGREPHLAIAGQQLDAALEAIVECIQRSLVRYPGRSAGKQFCGMQNKNHGTAASGK